MNPGTEEIKEAHIKEKLPSRLILGRTRRRKGGGRRRGWRSMTRKGKWRRRGRRSSLK